MILTNWFIRKEEFSFLSKIRAYQNITGVIIQILLGIIGLKPVGLLIGSIFKRALGAIPMIKKIFNKNDVKKYNYINKKNFINTIVEFKKFPMISSFSAIINTLGINLPFLLISKFYGNKNLGYFSLAIMVISIPVNTIGRALSQVYLREASKLYFQNKNKLKNFTIKIIKNLFYISLIPCLILLFEGKILFIIIFGLKWEKSGIITQILSLVFLIQFISIPTSQILNILKKQEIQLFWDVFRIISLTFAFFIPYYLNKNFIFAIYFYSIIVTFNYLLYLFIQYFYLKKIII